ncbi:MAG TPA: TIGR03943 family protein [Planctomycetaceae bacterium]|nr:TIGR03943 family protein [Planctomycetaceae bacterium]
MVIGLEVAAFVGLAAFMAWSYFAGRLKYFLAPEFHWLPLLAAVGLVAMALARWWWRGGGAVDCECAAAPRRPWVQMLCVGILAVPVALGLAVHPTRYSAQGLKKRSLNLPPHDPVLDQVFDWAAGIKPSETAGASPRFLLPAEPTILDLLTAVTQGRAQQLEGRFVHVIGQCDPLAEGRLSIYRLVVTCCIADATAMAIEVVPSAPISVQAGGWLRVGGIIRFDSPHDPSLPVVHATTVEKIAEPAEPYL